MATKKNEGNKNAQKGDEAASSTLHARVTPTNKAAWVKRAQAEKIKLTEWVIKTLNEAT